MFLSPTGGGLLLSSQKLSQRTADSTWLQVREPLETSTAPVLHVGTSEVTSGHRAGETPSREEHSTLLDSRAENLGTQPQALSPSPIGPPIFATHPADGADDGHAQCHRGRSMWAGLDRGR